MRKRNKKLLSVGIALAMLSVFQGGISVYASEDEYDLDPVIVNANRQLTPSQKFVLTGGDVSIITREQIEQRHFSDIKEALLTVPGVTIASPGYHAQAYQESSYASDTIRVNGDNRVLILIDGRRMDIGVSSASGSSRSKSNLALLTGINNIERIEVIKGQGSLAYGSDATSIINIITRKGSATPTGKVSASIGSWGKRTYTLAQAGQTGAWKYMINASKTKGDDTKYKDYYLNKTVTYKNSSYDDKSAGISISRDFDDNRSLEINFSHMSNLDHFPISALDYKHPYIPGYSNLGSWYPGYRNMFKGDQDDGVYTQTLANDINATYTFAKDHDIPTYLTVYKNYHRYYEMDGIGWTPTDIESGIGAHFEYGRLFRDKDVFLTGVEVKHGKYHYNEGAEDAGQDSREFYQTWTTRDDLSFYVQDKIKATDNLIVTPGLRYSRYGKTSYKTREWDSDTNSAQYKTIHLKEYNRLTGGLFTNWTLSKKVDLYASWSQTFNAPFASDIRKNTDIKPETGNVYTLGVKYKVSPKTSTSLGFTYADINNAIVRYSYLNPSYNPDTMKPSKRWTNKSINLDQTKQGINFDVEHEFSPLWKATFSYTHNITHQIDADNQDNPQEDENYRREYPDDLYKLDINYHTRRWNTDLFATYYGGANTKYFSDSHFLIFDATVNYKVTKESNIFLKMMNLTNQTYETKATAWGIGAFPQPGRNYELGFEYKF